MDSRQFFLLLFALERATQGDLDNLVTNVYNIFDRYTAGGQITDVAALTRDLNEITERFYDVYVEHLQISAQAVGELRAEQAISQIIPLLRKARLYGEATSLYMDIRNYGNDVAKRLMTSEWSGSTLGKKITTLRTGTQRTVENIILNGVAKQKSAFDIARDIEQYVNPVPNGKVVAPYEEYRKRWGRPLTANVKGKVPAGSVSYNAMRIARTETAFIYRRSATDFYDNRDWVKGYSWNLSNRHKERDVCDDYAAQTYETSADLPQAHPNCLCDVRPILMTPREMAGLNDNEYEVGSSILFTKAGNLVS